MQYPLIAPPCKPSPTTPSQEHISVANEAESEFKTESCALNISEVMHRRQELRRLDELLAARETMIADKKLEYAIWEEKHLHLKEETERVVHTSAESSSEPSSNSLVVPVCNVNAAGCGG